MEANKKASRLIFTARPFNRLTIKEAMYDMYCLDRAIQTVHAEIAKVMTSGNTSQGVNVRGEHDRDFVKACYDGLDKMERTKASLTELRNRTNDRTMIEIDGKEMSLNRANSYLSDLTKDVGEMMKYAHLPDINDDLAYRAKLKADYNNRLREAVSVANRETFLILPN